jgi:gliding motility-associated-like protein
LLLSLLFFQEALATHIVGGQIYYRYLGGNSYRITLNLYMDCFNGNDNAIQMDKESIIGVFDMSENGRLRDKYTLFNPSEKEISKLNYNCVKPFTDQCVTEFSFQRTITLPPNRDGYVIAYQRCCRNGIITNINTPGDVGATYWTKIPGRDITQENSSAYFRNLPPNFLCLGAPMVFDHSAIDTDGDSLIYELFTPFVGGNSTNLIKPDPPAGPPYNQVSWRQGYNANNQLNGNPTLEIDRYTGQLTCTPTRTGQYVVGVKVIEYRNGVKVGETMRDFQFYVRQCEFDVVSAFSTPTYNCDKTVQFTNLSQKATSYIWDFGDPTSDDDVSNEFEPSYTYPSDGDYFAKLKVRNLDCEDEYSIVVRVRSEIDVPLPPDTAFCGPFSLNLNAENPRATSIRWSNGSFGPLTTISEPGIHWAEVSYGDCRARDSILAYLDTFDVGLPPDKIYCDSVSGELTVPDGIRDLHRVRWDDVEGDTSWSIKVSEPGFYSVEAWNKHCSARDTIELFISTVPELEDSFFFCNEFELELDAGGHRYADYTWQNGSKGRYFNATRKGIYWVELRQRQCVSRDSVIIENPVIDLELGPDEHFCDTLYKRLVAPEGMADYQWSTDSKEPSIIVRTPGVYRVFVTDTNNCSKQDSIVLTLTNSPEIDLGADTAICLRTAATYGIKQDFVSYLWSNGTRSRETFFTEAGEYWLQVVDEYGCTDRDTVNVKIDPEALPNDLYIPNAFSPNGDGLNEVFPFKERVQQADYRFRVWNRWGEKLFDTREDANQFWTGDHANARNGRPEAFIYMIEYRGCDGDTRRDSGTLTILR